jgi:hypothetical protein
METVPQVASAVESRHLNESDAWAKANSGKMCLGAAADDHVPGASAGSKHGPGRVGSWVGIVAKCSGAEQSQIERTGPNQHAVALTGKLVMNLFRLGRKANLHQFLDCDARFQRPANRVRSARVDFELKGEKRVDLDEFESPPVSTHQFGKPLSEGEWKKASQQLLRQVLYVWSAAVDERRPKFFPGR